MRHRLLSLFIFALALVNVGGLLPYSDGEVLGLAMPVANAQTSSDEAPDTQEFNIKVQTTTAFDQTEIVEYEAIPYEIEYIEDNEMEYGLEEILEPGVEGTKTLTYLLTYWLDEEIDKQLIKTEIEEPKAEKVSKGTKIIWREYMTPDVGGVSYWYKLRVWATKYDANCAGCWGRTYSGTEVKKGVCAVDPNVIKLGTNFYVEGYGLCRAEDIGGAIKGDKIDLGYENAAEGAWRTGYTNIYLLTNAP